MDLEDYIQHQIERHLSAKQVTRVGLVTSYDPTTHSLKATIQPEGQESGWLPIPRQSIGNGWGIVAGPTTGDGKTTGDQVQIEFHGGDFEAGRIVGFIHSDVDKPPQVESGEILIQHQDGRFIKFDTAGNSIVKHGTTTAQTTILANGHHAKMTISGKFIYLGQEILTPGTAPTDVKYALVSTISGPSICVKAQITA